MMRPFTPIAILLALCLSLSGCSATSGLSVLLSGVPKLASAGVKQTFGGGASTTFKTGSGNVRQATEKVLAAWSAPIKSVEKEGPQHWQIVASTKEWTYEVDIEQVSTGKTRMKVVARKGFFLRDHTKSGQFIEATKEMLAKA